MNVGTGIYSPGNILENIHLTKFTALFVLIGQCCKMFNRVYILCLNEIQTAFSVNRDSQNQDWTNSPGPSGPMYAYRKVNRYLNNPWHFLFHLKLHFSPPHPRRPAPLKQENKEAAKITLVELLVSIQKNPSP